MKKIGELNALAGSFVIYYDECDRFNHYKLYKKWYDRGWHRKLIEKYGDLYSCTIWINEFIMNHNEERR